AIAQGGRPGPAVGAAEFTRVPVQSLSWVACPMTGLRCVSQLFGRASRARPNLIICALFILLLSTSQGAAGPQDPTYWHDIRPVLRKNCTACHNRKNQREPDVSGGLALDSYEAVRKGAKEPVVQPGKSSASLLIQRVTANDDDKRMPLGATPLAPEAVALLRRWIDTGAREGIKPEDHPDTTATSIARRSRKLE